MDILYICRFSILYCILLSYVVFPFFNFRRVCFSLSVCCLLWYYGKNYQNDFTKPEGVRVWEKPIKCWCSCRSRDKCTDLDLRQWSTFSWLIFTSCVQFGLDQNSIFWASRWFVHHWVLFEFWMLFLFSFYFLLLFPYLCSCVKLNFPTEDQ